MNGPGLVVDLFAGGGGASLGIEAALGRPVDVAVNHSPVALAVHAANHPGTQHLTSDIWDVSPTEVARGRPVQLLWASPDCTHFSRAKGGKPRSKNIRSLAWVVVDWAVEVRPAVICLENVPEFVTWGPLDEEGQPDKARAGETFQEWKRVLERIGYVVDHRVICAADHGTPTVRRRLFLVARCDGRPITWPAATHAPAAECTGKGLDAYRTAAECIDWTLHAPSIFERTKPLAAATQRRIAAGLKRFVLEHPDPFVVNNGAPVLVQTSYGERPGQRPRYLDLHAPLGTVVAEGQKHALVVAWLAQHFSGMTGKHLAEQPLPTVTAVDHHSLCTATLDGSPDRREQVRAFLTAYYGAPHESGQDLRDPLRTVVGADRFGLVTVAGREHVITDIGMRMLAPHELLRAQFGCFAEGYDMSIAKTTKDKVKLIGNSVCPEVAEALVRAQFPLEMRRAA